MQFKVMPLVNTRFATAAQRDSALTKTHWNLPEGTIVALLKIITTKVERMYQVLHQAVD